MPRLQFANEPVAIVKWKGPRTQARASPRTGMARTTTAPALVTARSHHSTSAGRYAATGPADRSLPPGDYRRASSPDAIPATGWCAR